MSVGLQKCPELSEILVPGTSHLQGRAVSALRHLHDKPKCSSRQRLTIIITIITTTTYQIPN
jgi:hypothetical protein